MDWLVTRRAVRPAAARTPAPLAAGAARILVLAALAWVAAALPAAAERVQLGYGDLYVDLPWVKRADSEIGSGPAGRGVSRTITAIFWSDEEGRMLAIMAIIPQPYTYFSGSEPPLSEDIAQWGFFDDKTVTEQRGVACAFGSCLAFRADNVGCAVFRRQIGSAGKQRMESYKESAGPRIYGFYCSAGKPTLDARELDGVLRGIGGG
jgi:hypothetical protein